MNSVKERVSAVVQPKNNVETANTVIPASQMRIFFCDFNIHTQNVVWFF
jgi:hypothetical protein